MLSTPFEISIRVRFHEVDALGHVNNAAYLNYLEQAAIDHALYVGLNLERSRGLGGVFVAHRHDIRFLRPAFAGDLLRIVTWVQATTAVRVERRYQILRAAGPDRTDPRSGQAIPVSGEEVADEPTLIVEASTDWVFVNERFRPRRIPDEIRELFGDAASPSGGQTRET